MSTDIQTWEAVVSSYAPSIPPATWRAIRPFVTAVAREAGPRLSYPPRRVLHALTLLGCLAVEQGWELDRGELLRREVIDYAVSSHFTDLAASSRASIRPILLRVGEALQPRNLPVRLSALPAANAAQAYSGDELRRFRGWAQGQRGHHILDAMALLGLGAGAGLSAGELLRLRGKDLVGEAAGHSVRVENGRPRIVPVLGSWDRLVGRVAAERAGEEWVFRPGRSDHGRNHIGNFIGRSVDCGYGRPQLQRLRATWIVTHLSAGTHTIALLRAAGVDSLEALTRYLPFASEPSLAESDIGLRRAG